MWHERFGQIDQDAIWPEWRAYSDHARSSCLAHFAFHVSAMLCDNLLDLVVVCFVQDFTELLNVFSHVKSCFRLFRLLLCHPALL